MFNKSDDGGPPASDPKVNERIDALELELAKLELTQSNQFKQLKEQLEKHDKKIEERLDSTKGALEIKVEHSE